MRALNKEIVVATRNSGKTREFASLFEPLGIQVRSLNDFPDAPDIVEDGETFEANARKKAKVISEAFGLPVLADDSGLCVDALNGAPGVYSARYAGEGLADSDNNAKLLRELNRLVEEGAIVPERVAVAGEEVRLLSPARFVCVLALYDPDAPELTVEGECAGVIVDRPLGEAGFGYDPLFYVRGAGQTMSQMPLEAKNGISHRAAAMRKLQELLKG
jgi:XTP/dITP diphosphohydrolase